MNERFRTILVWIRIWDAVHMGPITSDVLFLRFSTITIRRTNRRTEIFRFIYFPDCLVVSLIICLGTLVSMELLWAGCPDSKIILILQTLNSCVLFAIDRWEQCTMLLSAFIDTRLCACLRIGTNTIDDRRLGASVILNQYTGDSRSWRLSFNASMC